MATSIGSACGKCGRARFGSERLCTLCGALLDAEVEESVVRARSRPTTLDRNHLDRVEKALAERKLREREDASRSPWHYLALGLATAPVFAWTPILQYMGWFLASLVHEMGHAAFAWLCGMPAVPAISLDGHAAAVHGEQSVGLALLVLGALVLGAWRLFAGRARVIAIATIVVVQSLFAWTGLKDVAFLLSGHGGELAFATLALWKTIDGGFTSSRFERVLYGTVGWYLAGKNVILCAGLLTSAAARAAYAGNGSFGLTNDYLRLSEDVLGWRLETIALLMLIASVATIPLAIAGSRVGRRRFGLGAQPSGGFRTTSA